MIGKLIGRGNTADVYDIGNNKAVKLFKTGYLRDSVEKEYENSKIINKLLIHTVKSYELIEYGGRYGIIYEKIEGRNMLDIIMGRKDLEKYTKILAVLHKELLSCEETHAMTLKSILKNNIERTDKLSLNCKSEYIKILGRLPEGNCLCHGDFHFGNIMVNEEMFYIIDYMNVCKGNRHGDIARTVYLIEMTPIPSIIQDIDHYLNMKKQVTNFYLKEMGVSREALSDWLLIVAAARLSELSENEIDERNSIFGYLGIQE